MFPLHNKFQNSESGLYYLQSRYYEPELGRFLNADEYTSTGQGLLGFNMFSYCGNNPAIRVDFSGNVFNTLCGAIVGGVISVITRGESESAGSAFLHGLVTGAVAGVGLDICIATGGAGGLLIAGALGAGAAIVDTAWEARNNGDTASIGDMAVGGVVGGSLNILFGAAGRVATNVIGSTVKSVWHATLTNTTKSITNRAGKIILQKAVNTTIENMAYSTLQSSFGKIFTLVGSKMLEVFEK